MSTVATTLLPSVPDPLTIAHRAQHAALFAAAAVSHRAFPVARPPPADWQSGDALPEMRRRVAALMRADRDDARDGVYPASLLFHRDVPRAAARWAWLMARRRAIVRRRDAGAWRDLPADVDLSEYPPFYRRTFHWQDDGYLSARSAALYDVGVEVLFLGTAGPMRRRVLRPIVRALPDGRGRVLDVACGTGRTLYALSQALPQATLHGVDLSGPYLDEARRLVGDRATLQRADACALPFHDASFDVVTTTWLLHELPADARRRTLREMARVVKPGGTVVVLASAQHVESPALRPILTLFPRDFHEPYYAGFLDDPVEDLAAEAGLRVQATTPWALSKCVVANRPLSG